MEARPKSGYTLPNRFARVTLEAIEGIVGPEGMRSLLNAAHLPHLIGNYPPANLERGFDFSEFSAVNWSLEEQFGPRGSRGLAQRAGRETFARTLNLFGPLAGRGDKVFKALPLGIKLRLALPALARVSNAISDQTSSVKWKKHEIHYLVQRSAVCWGGSGEEKPVCYFMIGLLLEALHRLSDGREFRVDEAECLAANGAACRFVIQKIPLS